MIQHIDRLCAGYGDAQVAEPSDVGVVAQASFEEYLSVPGTPEADYNFFRDRWTFGTCSWVLDNQGFKDWAEDTSSDPRVLWIHGNAASGKSILSSFIIDHLTQRGFPCSYFFVRFTDHKKRGLSGILRSLACQMARSVPVYGNQLRCLQDAATDLKTADARNVWQWLYRQSLFQLDISEPLFLVVDGVDEAENPASILRLLTDLHLCRIPLRVLIVSRKTHEISSGFQRLEKQVHVDAIPVEGNQDDIRSYIANEMDIAGDESYRDEITSQLLQRAQGNFLWIHLAVQKINNCHTKLSVENALQDLPSGMGALYD
ncbi:ATP-binding protein, partial [Candidatus Bathyarchaeota archaeon]|nr:ATP-binding protein [Candidatus Bathyarchaeota archaeon]